MARGGGRGGGGGGGSRGGGFGGSRGGGGRSSAGRGGGSFGSSSSRGSSSGSSWGSNRSSGSYSSGPNIFMGPMFGSTRRRRTTYYGGSNYSNGSGGSSSSGCITTTIILGIVVLVLIFVLPNMFGSSGGSSGSNNSITASTIAREPLASGSVNETDYYTDDAGWVESRTVLNNGLEYFYDKTGVQPHVYITTDINGNNYASMSQVEDYANEMYDELFTDEAHLLLMFYEGTPNNYISYYVTGSQADTVIDTEAGDILLDYIDRYYYDTSLNTSEFFAKSFRDAADRMMEVTRSPWIPVLMVIGVVAIIGILFLWWRKRKEQDEIEAKRTEEMLNKPLDTFGTQSEADELAKKYSDDTE